MTAGFSSTVVGANHSLASERRGYVVGNHGMIFRYRIVPVDYKAKGLIDAPIMTPSGK